MSLDKTKIMLLTLAVACAVASIFITKIPIVQYAKCSYVIVPGPNITSLGDGKFILNINRSLFNETIRVFTLETHGPCTFVIIPYVRLIDLRFHTFNITFIINNQTVSVGQEITADTVRVEPIRVGPSANVTMLLRTDAEYGRAIIYTVVKIYR